MLLKDVAYGYSKPVRLLFGIPKLNPCGIVNFSYIAWPRLRISRDIERKCRDKIIRTPVYWMKQSARKQWLLSRCTRRPLTYRFGFWLRNKAHRIILRVELSFIWGTIDSSICFMCRFFSDATRRFSFTVRECWVQDLLSCAGANVRYVWDYRKIVELQVLQIWFVLFLENMRKWYLCVSTSYLEISRGVRVVFFF